MVGHVPLLLFAHHKRIDALDNILRQGLHYTTDQFLDILKEKDFFFEVPIKEMEETYITFTKKGFSSTQIKQIVIVLLL